MEKLKNKKIFKICTLETNCRDVNIRKLVMLSLFMSFYIISQAQVFSPTVIASAGASGTSATCIIDWTLGEIAIETFTQTSTILTQGFQQNFLSNPTAIEIAEKSEFSFYPNPAKDCIYLNLKQAHNENVNVEIFNIKGTKVWSSILESAKDLEKIDINSLPSGMYMLRISSRQGKILKTNKFIKL